MQYDGTQGSMLAELPSATATANYGQTWEVVRVDGPTDGAAGNFTVCLFNVGSQTLGGVHYTAAAPYCLAPHSHVAFYTDLTNLQLK